MLEWLKPILGDQYTEEIDKKVSAEIGKAFVAKADFNVANDTKKQLEKDLAARDQQIETLKKVDPDKLKQQIEDLQKQNKADKETFEAQIKQTRLDAAVEKALTQAKAKNAKAVKALLDLEKAELDDAGTVKGLDEQLKKLAKAEDSAFLFGDAEQPPIDGAKPGEPGSGGKSKAPKDMNYPELCAYLEANPGAPLD